MQFLPKNTAGFTLIEIVVVIALSAILLVIALYNINPRQENSEFVLSYQDMKSEILSAQSMGSAGIADNSYIGSGDQVCGTYLQLNGDGSYEIDRIYQTSGNTLDFVQVGSGKPQDSNLYVQYNFANNQTDEDDSSINGAGIYFIANDTISGQDSQPFGQAFVFPTNSKYRSGYSATYPAPSSSVNMTCNQIGASGNNADPDAIGVLNITIYESYQEWATQGSNADPIATIQYSPANGGMFTSP